MLTLPLWISLILGLILVPLLRKVSLRIGIFDKPRADRWHSQPTPKIGGVGIFLAFTTGLLIYWLYQPGGEIEWGLLAGSTLIFALGLLDDFKQISPPAKLVGQILAAAIVVFFGRTIGFFPWEFLNIIFTFLWLVGITNAINLLDNMDGVAGGVALIAAGMLSYLFWQINMQGLMVISLALAGGTLGFLVFNFPPASIFMGDSGSQFIGFTLAALAIARVPRASNVLAVMGVPIMLFVLPILDTTLVTITRILRGQSPAQGGKDHTSHRLIAFGLSERQAVLTLYGVALISGIVGTVLESLDYGISLILIPTLLLTLTLFTAYLGRFKMVHPASANTQGNITRLMINLTWRGRLFEIALDFILISLAYYLAFWIQYGLPIDTSSLDLFLRSLPIALASSFISFFIFGIYRGVWPYVGMRDILRFARAMIGAAVIVAIAVPLLYPSPEYSPTIFILFGLFLFIGLAVSRSSFRMLDQVYSPQTRPQKEDVPIVIYGADDSGEIALRWILQQPDLGYRPVGFIDDDPFKWGRQIHGIRVIGDINQIETSVQNQAIKGVILTSTTPKSNEEAQKILENCQKCDIWVRRLHVEFDLVE